MRDESGRRPPSAGVCAVPRLQSGSKVTEGDALAVAEEPSCTRGARGIDPPCGTTEHRLEHDTSPVARGGFVRTGACRCPCRRVEEADDLVAGDEGEADQVLEIARAAPVERREVRAADARKDRRDATPFRRGESGGLGLEEPQRADG